MQLVVLFNYFMNMYLNLVLYVYYDFDSVFLGFLLLLDLCYFGLIVFVFFVIGLIFEKQLFIGLLFMFVVCGLFIFWNWYKLVLVEEVFYKEVVVEIVVMYVKSVS